MRHPKKTAGERKPSPSPNEAECRAMYRLLFAAKTREENRVAVRLLLRQASRNLERSR